MVTQMQFSEGEIDVVLAQSPAGGWDIVSVRVAGRDANARRKGEFETEADARTAAIAKAEAFAKAQEIDLRR